MAAEIVAETAVFIGEVDSRFRMAIIKRANNSNTSYTLKLVRCER
jgi:hypothetical protein